MLPRDVAHDAHVAVCCAGCHAPRKPHILCMAMPRDAHVAHTYVPRKTLMSMCGSMLRVLHMRTVAPRVFQCACNVFLTSFLTFFNVFFNVFKRYNQLACNVFSTFFQRFFSVFKRRNVFATFCSAFENVATMRHDMRGNIRHDMRHDATCEREGEKDRERDMERWGATLGVLEGIWS
jgi:hypothetical protein